MLCALCWIQTEQMHKVSLCCFKCCGLAAEQHCVSFHQALAYIYDKDLVRNLFKQVPERYSERNGGYCRVVPEYKRRRGDGTELVSIELV